MIGILEVYLYDDEMVELDMDAMLSIGQDISDEFTHQAATYGYIAMLTAQAEAVYLDAKENTRLVAAAEEKATRQWLVDHDEKVTDKKVEALVRLDEQCRQAIADEITAREQHQIMKGMAAAMRMRGEMLISLGAQQRSEADQTGMTIKGEDAAAMARKMLSDSQPGEEYEPPFPAEKVRRFDDGSVE